MPCSVQQHWKTCFQDLAECICKINWIEVFWNYVSGIKRLLNSSHGKCYLSFIPCYLLGQTVVTFILLLMIHSIYSISGMLRKSSTNCQTFLRRSCKGWQSFLVSVRLIYKIKSATAGNFNSHKGQLQAKSLFAKIPCIVVQSFQKNPNAKTNQSTKYYSYHLQVKY